MITDTRGFTLVEILISLAIFAVVVVGALGVLGAAGSGGFLEGFPTGFTTTRTARDMTAASVYLQTFHEYASGLVSSTLNPGTYSATPGVSCSTTLTLTGSGLVSPPAPPGPPCAYPYQLNWQSMTVKIEQWYACFNTATTPPTFIKYAVPPGSGCSTDTTKEYLVRIDSTLTWQYCPRPTQCATRSLEVGRFLP